MNHKYNTFWDIISNDKIEVPIIQRDYAYGRKTAADIMKKFIEDIENSIRLEKTINLDFVYGKLLGKENEVSLERNRNNIVSLLKTIKSYASDLNVEIEYALENQEKKESNVTFIPLDGQQRLTTLFLVHWYIAQKNNDTQNLAILKRFSYATRMSSKDFCQMICEFNLNKHKSNSTVSEIIKNDENYFSYWEKDPTVNSMLVVIDEIQRVFDRNSPNYELYWKLITESNIITFDFFDLDDFDLTDELYIKMNARGKHLTNFENFKAWLIKSYENSISVQDWKKKFDIQWNDLFWKAKEKANYTIDAEFLHFFKILFLGDYLKSQDTSSNGMKDEADLQNYETSELNLKDFKSVVSILRKKDANPIEIFQKNTSKKGVLEAEVLEKEDIFRNQINRYLKLLDLLNSLYSSIDKDTDLILNKYISINLSKLLLGDKLSKLTWKDTTLFYAVTSYLIEVNGNNQYFSQWVRVISNLIYNAKLDTPELFIDAMKSIDSLVGKIKEEDIYVSLSRLPEDDIASFSTIQKKEEIRKARLITENKEWEAVFIEAEKHPYFYGQIGFILNMCDSPISIEIFKNYYNRVAALFSDTVLLEKDYLLIRSLLTQVHGSKNCFYMNGDNRTFSFNDRITVRNRNENWRKFFEDKLEYIKSLINHELFDENKIIESLNQIIQVELPKLKEKEDKRYYIKFIENPALLAYTKKHVIRKWGEHGYYLLNSTRMSGYFVELYTYDWGLRKNHEYTEKYKSANVKIGYNFVRGQDDEPGITFDIEGAKSIIVRDFKTGDFEVRDMENGNNLSSNQFKTIEETISYLLNDLDHAITH